MKNFMISDSQRGINEGLNFLVALGLSIYTKAPDGLFEKIEREPDNICLYKCLFLDYTYGLDRIYTTGDTKGSSVTQF